MINKNESMGMVTTKTIHELDYTDFNKLVQEVYEHYYNIVEDEELENDSYQTYNNIIKQTLDEFDKNDLEEFKKTGNYSYNYNFLSTILLTDLVNEGYLPEGNYVIKVCW